MKAECLGSRRVLLDEAGSPEQTGKKTSLFLRCTLQSQEGRKQKAQRWSGKILIVAGEEPGTHFCDWENV